MVLMKTKSSVGQHQFSHNKNKVRMDMYYLLPLSSDFTPHNTSQCEFHLIYNRTHCCLIFNLASTAAPRPFPAALSAGVNCNLRDCSHKAKHVQLPLAQNCHVFSEIRYQIPLSLGSLHVKCSLLSLRHLTEMSQHFEICFPLHMPLKNNWEQEVPN